MTSLRQSIGDSGDIPLMNKLDNKLIDALRGERTPKFLATADRSGTPNVIPVISIEPWDEETLIFGNYLMWKTARNLESNPLVSVSVITEKFYGATILGRFLEFQRAGKFVDRINSSTLFRYNAYTGIRNAGSIRVERVLDPFQVSRKDILFANLGARLGCNQGRKMSRGKRIMNPVITGKFRKITAIKVVAFIDENGYPRSVPVMSLQPAAPDVLVFRFSRWERYLTGLNDGATVSACVLTPEPVAFQVKGEFHILGKRLGLLLLAEAYHASLPLPGKRVAAYPSTTCSDRSRAKGSCGHDICRRTETGCLNF